MLLRCTKVSSDKQGKNRMQYKCWSSDNLIFLYSHFNLQSDMIYEYKSVLLNIPLVNIPFFLSPALMIGGKDFPALTGFMSGPLVSSTGA